MFPEGKPSLFPNSNFSKFSSPESILQIPSTPTAARRAIRPGPKAGSLKLGGLPGAANRLLWLPGPGPHTRHNSAPATITRKGALFQTPLPRLFESPPQLFFLLVFFFGFNSSISTPLTTNLRHISLFICGLTRLKCLMRYATSRAKSSYSFPLLLNACLPLILLMMNPELSASTLWPALSKNFLKFFPKTATHISSIHSFYFIFVHPLSMA